MEAAVSDALLYVSAAWWRHSEWYGAGVERVLAGRQLTTDHAVTTLGPAWLAAAAAAAGTDDGDRDGRLLCRHSSSLPPYVLAVDRRSLFTT